LIILDTNMLWGVSPDNASVDLLKTIRATGVQGVAVPWTVMEELAAQRAPPRSFSTTRSLACGFIWTGIMPRSPG
jgi:hypothetical protein